MVTSKSYRAGVWLAVLAAFGFSMKAILVKLAYAEPQAQPVAPITLLALRMGFALPFFLFVALRESRNSASLNARQWLGVLVMGLLGYYCASIFDFIGLRYISAGLERLILFTYPTLTLLIGAVFFGQAVGRREIGALVLCYLGIGAAFAHDLQASTDQAAVWVGAGFVMLSSISYALYLSGSGRLIPLLGASRFTALALAVSGLATLVHFFIAQPVSALVQPLPVYGYALAMALLSTVFPVFAQSAAIRRIGSGRAALIGTLGPLLTIGMGWWVLGESISLWQLAGAALVVAGILRVSRPG
ncbi:DMT family transporter [Denitratisoma oestradiolicum]|uniref:Multidrug DMT transporter permease n=1 Tax=Denitratisoma oestradiolicum TaxID=311182 RepID=A0A6S6XZP7_9PROT|nr:DMT family transporter [Denitratisoma oestradiolicum]TWO81625.1 EamA family transporter [Denitratisoma oestradiolicum]CAB1370568.1 Multidrug DMT transporter permease [Denitratisoma oestradiolicum]